MSIKQISSSRREFSTLKLPKFCPLIGVHPISMIGGFILMRFHEPLGLAIGGGVAASFYLCALEMWITAKPYDARNVHEAQDKSKKSMESDG